MNKGVLSSIIRRHKSLARYRSTIFSDHLDAFLRQQAVRGYPRSCLLKQLQGLYHFSEFLRSRGIDHPSAIRDLDVFEFQRVSRFVRGLRGHWGDANAAAKRLFLFIHGREPRDPKSVPERPGHPAIEAFGEFLRKHRGLSEISLRQNRRWAGRFVDYVLKTRGRRLDRTRPEDVEAFVSLHATPLPRCWKRALLWSVRNFLVFLHLTGRTKLDLSTFVPTQRTYGYARLPRGLKDHEVKALLRSFDGKRSADCRNFAMVLLLARYGLRPGDVIRLSLDNIDWQSKDVVIVQDKTRTPLQLPLSDDVAKAIIDYLKKDRPKSAHRQLFLSRRAPFEPLRSVEALQRVLYKQLKKIGINEPRGGPRAFRHALAKRLVIAGVPFKAIGDTLGHRSPEATFIYAKVDTESLRGLCLDPPVSRHVQPSP